MIRMTQDDINTMTNRILNFPIPQNAARVIRYIRPIPAKTDEPYGFSGVK